MFARLLTRKRVSIVDQKKPDPTALERKIHPHVDSLLDERLLSTADAGPPTSRPMTGQSGQSGQSFRAPEGEVGAEDIGDVPSTTHVLTTRLSQIADRGVESAYTTFGGHTKDDFDSAGSATESIPSQSTNQSRRSSRRRHSPGTFGHPTPPTTQRHAFPSPSPRPPLPPLHHPEINGQPRTLRASSSLPEPKTVAVASPRARSMSRPLSKKSMVRRSSADWSAREATSPTESMSWQAQVSREILRLSFGGSEDMAPHVAVIADRKEMSCASTFSPRGCSRADGRHPHPVPPFTPPTSLGSPFFLQEAGEVDDKLKYPRGDTSHSLFYHTRVMEHHELDARNAVPATPRRQTASSSKQPTLKPPEFAYTSPTPDSPPGHSKRAPSEPSQSALKVPSTETPTRKCSTSTGKRKADDVEGTPPDMKEKRTSFAPDPDVRSHRASATSNSSRAPSSYHRKRARLSTTSPVQTPTRPANTGSCSSRTSNTPAPLPQVPPRAVSRATSNRSAVTQGNPKPNPHPKGPRRSMSAASIPLSALISPHAPSISRSSTFHMRDPRRPPKKRTTGWALKLRTEEEAASPTHAWMFFLGFLVFPLWWVASFWRIPITRKVGGGIDEEKAVTLDDPQVEFDARSWRKRCRVMSCVAFVTYVPFIVLVAVFVR